MGGRPRIIPDQTYVLDDKDLEASEELTIETVMKDVLDSGEDSNEESDEGAKPASRSPVRDN